MVRDFPPLHVFVHTCTLELYMIPWCLFLAGTVDRWPSPVQYQSRCIRNFALVVLVLVSAMLLTS